jgi:hypothetical protein
MDKNKIINQINLIIHNLETEISKKKNDHQKGMMRILIGGLILIFINWYYMCCFLGIYENSYDCLAVNLVLSILYSLLVSLLVYLLSVSLRKCVIPKEEKEKKEEIEKTKEKCNIKMFMKERIFDISELFNPQYKYFCLCCCQKSCFSCAFCRFLSCICTYICCCWFNEKKIHEYVENKDKEEKRKKREEKERKKSEEKERKEKEEKERKEKEKKEIKEKEEKKNLIDDERDKKSGNTTVTYNIKQMEHDI